MFLKVLFKDREMPIISDAQSRQFWGDGYNPDIHICVYDGVGGGCFEGRGGAAEAIGNVA